MFHMDKFTKSLLVAALSVAVVALIAFWLSQYQYHNTNERVLVRTNRYTGHTEFYIVGRGWEDTLRPAATPTPNRGYINPFDSPSPSPGR